MKLIKWLGMCLVFVSIFQNSQNKEIKVLLSSKDLKKLHHLIKRSHESTRTEVDQKSQNIRRNKPINLILSPKKYKTEQNIPKDQVSRLFTATKQNRLPNADPSKKHKLNSAAILNQINNARNLARNNKNLDKEQKTVKAKLSQPDLDDKKVESQNTSQQTVIKQKTLTSNKTQNETKIDVKKPTNENNKENRSKKLKNKTIFFEEEDNDDIDEIDNNLLVKPFNSSSKSLEKVKKPKNTKISNKTLTVERESKNNGTKITTAEDAKNLEPKLDGKLELISVKKVKPVLEEYEEKPVNETSCESERTKKIAKEERKQQSALDGGICNPDEIAINNDHRVEQKSENIKNEPNSSITIDKTDITEVHEKQKINNLKTSLPQQEKAESKQYRPNNNHGQGNQYFYSYAFYQTIPYFFNNRYNYQNYYKYPWNQSTNERLANYFGNQVYDKHSFGENEEIVYEPGFSNFESPNLSAYMYRPYQQRQPVNYYRNQICDRNAVGENGKMDNYFYEPESYTKSPNLSNYPYRQQVNYNGNQIYDKNAFGENGKIDNYIYKPESLYTESPNLSTYQYRQPVNSNENQISDKNEFGKDGKMEKYVYKPESFYIELPNLSPKYKQPVSYYGNQDYNKNPFVEVGKNKFPYKENQLPI